MYFIENGQILNQNEDSSHCTSISVYPFKSCHLFISCYRKQVHVLRVNYRLAHSFNKYQVSIMGWSLCYVLSNYWFIFKPVSNGFRTILGFSKTYRGIYFLYMNCNINKWLLLNIVLSALLYAHHHSKCLTYVNLFNF